MDKVLPSECIAKVITFIGYPERFRLQLVCRCFRDVVNNLFPNIGKVSIGKYCKSMSLNSKQVGAHDRLYKMLISLVKRDKLIEGLIDAIPSVCSSEFLNFFEALVVSKSRTSFHSLELASKTSLTRPEQLRFLSLLNVPDFALTQFTCSVPYEMIVDLEKLRFLEAINVEKLRVFNFPPTVKKLTLKYLEFQVSETDSQRFLESLIGCSDRLEHLELENVSFLFKADDDSEPKLDLVLPSLSTLILKFSTFGVEFKTSTIKNLRLLQSHYSFLQPQCFEPDMLRTLELDVLSIHKYLLAGFIFDMVESLTIGIYATIDENFYFEFARGRKLSGPSMRTMAVVDRRDSSCSTSNENRAQDTWLAAHNLGTVWGGFMSRIIWCTSLETFYFKFDIHDFYLQHMVPALPEGSHLIVVRPKKVVETFCTEQVKRLKEHEKMYSVVRRCTKLTTVTFLHGTTMPNDVVGGSSRCKSCAELLTKFNMILRCIHV